MSAPTRLLPEQTCRDTRNVLAELRFARVLNPKHREPHTGEPPHRDCGVCSAEARLDWLLRHLGKYFRGEYDER